MVRQYIFDSTYSAPARQTRFGVTFTRQGGMGAAITPASGMSASISPASGMTVRMIRVDSDEPHVLEVSPQIVWVVNGWTSNDVVSDLTWIIED